MSIRNRVCWYLLVLSNRKVQEQLWLSSEMTSKSLTFGEIISELNEDSLSKAIQSEKLLLIFSNVFVKELYYIQKLLSSIPQELKMKDVIYSTIMSDIRNIASKLYKKHWTNFVEQIEIAVEELSSREMQERLWLSDGSTGEVSSLEEVSCELFGAIDNALKVELLQKLYSREAIASIYLVGNIISDIASQKMEIVDLINHPKMQRIRDIAHNLHKNICGNSPT